MNESYKVIGLTMTSCVIKPAFPCESQTSQSDIDNLKNRVTKITSLKDLESELNEYRTLPGNSDAPYIKASDVILCKLPNSHKSIFEDLNRKSYTAKNPVYDIFDEKYFDYDESWQLQLPFLGIDLLNYLNWNFTAPNERVSSKTHVMSVLEMKNLYNLLVSSENSIYKTLELLNSQKIFHYDIKLNNILYNEDLNKLYLIDFGISKNKRSDYSKYTHFTTEIDYEYYDEITFLSKIILAFLYVCIGNKYVYDHMKPIIDELEELVQVKLNINKNNMPHANEKYNPIELKTQLIKPFLDKLTAMIVGLDDNSPNAFVLNEGDEPIRTPFKRYNASTELQRRKGHFYRQAKNEECAMGNEDKHKVELKGMMYQDQDVVKVETDRIRMMSEDVNVRKPQIVEQPTTNK